MEVTIRVQAPELAQAINALADAMKSFAEASVGIEVTEELQETAEEVRETVKRKKDKLQPAPEPAEATDQGDTRPWDEPEQQPIPLETVRAKLAELTRAGKGGAIKALLAEFGAKTLSEVPAEKRAELLARAAELA